MALTAMEAAIPVPALVGTSSEPAPRINLLITTFPGLGLPRTLSIPVSVDTSVHDALSTIYARLPNPDIVRSLIVTTTANKLLRIQDDVPISTLQSSSDADFIPLRISARLCGGKGGFGSQLRAAGGRMSSRKNRDRQNENGSNRNLDGRRLRTIDEAKRLADYLATKPEMEKREREERKKRWEAVVEAAESTEEKIKSGKMGSNQGRLDADYVESKQLAEQKVREAVMKAMSDHTAADGVTGSESSSEGRNEDSGDGDGDSDSAEEDERPEAGGSRSFFGWDDEEDEAEEESEINEVSEQLVKELASTVEPAGES